MRTPARIMAPLGLLSLALAGCNDQAEPVAPAGEMELAEDVDDGTVVDQMDSGAPEIREGGGRDTSGADNPNEPAVPEDAPVPDVTEPAEVR